jgi:hypothetical protein
MTTISMWSQPPMDLRIGRRVGQTGLESRRQTGGHKRLGLTGRSRAIPSSPMPTSSTTDSKHNSCDARPRGQKVEEKRR